MKIGYARVSREEQSFERQVTDLKAAGCEQVFADKIGGSTSSRPELDKMLAVLQPGDSVVIQKLDRLGRSVEHLKAMVKLFNQKKVGFVSLTEGIDTTTAVGQLLFHILGAVAEFEKSLVQERVKDGLRQARLNGKILGRPIKGEGEAISQATYYRRKAKSRLQTDN